MPNEKITGNPAEKPAEKVSENGAEKPAGRRDGRRGRPQGGPQNRSQRDKQQDSPQNKPQAETQSRPDRQAQERPGGEHRGARQSASRGGRSGERQNLRTTDRRSGSSGRSGSSRPVDGTAVGKPAFNWTWRDYALQLSVVIIGIVVTFAGSGLIERAGAEGAAKIAAIMGMEAPSGDKMVAHVLCNGGCNAKDNFEYRGVEDCLAATKVCGGDAKACRYGCFGFGSCVKACKFDAIHVIDGVAVVDKEKCTNCGACRAACPHHLIVEVPYKQKVFVNCSNKDKGPAVTKVCANSCIACGMCERTCKFDAIHVIDNVAVIDYSKCKNCTMCAKACPRNAIEPIPTAEEKEKFKAAQKAAAEKKASAAKAAAEAPKAE